MGKNSRTPRGKVLRPQKHFRVVDQGACADQTCPHFYPGIPHRHASAYFEGRASLDQIKNAELMLRKLGYVGELEVELVPRSLMYPLLEIS